MDIFVNFICVISESWPATLSADQFFSVLESNAGNGDIPPLQIGSAASLFWSFLRFFGATVLVAFLAYFATKKLASSGKLGQKKR